MAAPPPQGPDLDLSLWAAALTVAGFYWGPRAAQFISAYALILLGWFAGLLIGLYRRDVDSRMPTAVYVIVSLIGSVSFTVPFAMALDGTAGFGYTGLLLPVSLAIAALPDKWRQGFDKLVDVWQAVRGVKQ